MNLTDISDIHSIIEKEERKKKAVFFGFLDFIGFFSKKAFKFRFSLSKLSKI